MNEYDPDEVSPPGDTILELLGEGRGCSYNDMAHYLHISLKDFYALLEGKHPLTPEIASGLEEMFEVPVSFWLRREEHYRAKQQEN